MMTDFTYCTNGECVSWSCRRHWSHRPTGKPVSMSYFNRAGKVTCDTYYPGGDEYVNVSFPLYKDSPVYEKLRNLAIGRSQPMDTIAEGLLLPHMERLLGELMDSELS